MSLSLTTIDARCTATIIIIITRPRLAELDGWLTLGDVSAHCLRRSAQLWIIIIIIVFIFTGESHLLLNSHLRHLCLVKLPQLVLWRPFEPVSHNPLICVISLVNASQTDKEFCWSCYLTMMDHQLNQSNPVWQHPGFHHAPRVEYPWPWGILANQFSTTGGDI